MKTVTLFTIITFLTTLCFQCRKDPDTIKISDDHFLISLIDQGIDRDGDRKISPGEAAAVTFLDVSYDTISDISGIESFVNLDTLICSVNKIPTLDVSNLTRLVYLECGGNPIENLDLSQNVNLKTLSCRWVHTSLDELDLSNNPLLEEIDCEGDHMTQPQCKRPCTSKDTFLRLE